MREDTDPVSLRPVLESARELGAQWWKTLGAVPLHVTNHLIALEDGERT